MLYLYNLLWELRAEQKDLKHHVRDAEAEVTGRCPQSWSGVEIVSADCQGLLSINCDKSKTKLVSMLNYYVCYSGLFSEDVAVMYLWRVTYLLLLLSSFPMRKHFREQMTIYELGHLEAYLPFTQEWDPKERILYVMLYLGARHCQETLSKTLKWLVAWAAVGKYFIKHFVLLITLTGVTDPCSYNYFMINIIILADGGIDIEFLLMCF